jgi:meiotically up-regulated gene 157 (Mug157) protein
MEPIEQKAKEYAEKRHDTEFNDPCFSRDVADSIQGYITGAKAEREELKAKIEGMIKEYEADLNRVPYIETYAKIEVLQELINEIKCQE